MQDANIDPMRPESLASADVQPSTLWNGWSLEATLPKTRDIDALHDRLAPGSRVYLSALPRVPYAKQLKQASQIRAAGFDPVLHMAARKFRSREHLGEYLKEARGQAGIDKALVIAGDLNRPKGPYASSLDVISDDIFLGAGLTEIGIAGYPEGHPLIDNAEIDAELGLKINALILANMSVEIVTQFSFDAGAIVAWYDRLRRQGIICPIRIGLAGPASAATLLNLALRCGVNLPLRQTNKAAQLLRGASTQEIVASLAASPEIADSPHTVALHMYSFGGIARTAEWASELAAEG